MWASSTHISATESAVNWRKFHKDVSVINLHQRNRVSRELADVATWFYRTINKSALAKAQFPVGMSDARGAFRKPALW